MKTTIISISTFFFLLLNTLAQQPDYPQLRMEAEAQYAQGSYARAYELYSRVDQSKLSATDVRWVEFRLADTTWRAQSATQTSDTSRYEQAQKQLEELIRVVDKEADRDLVWAEAQESLVDSFWIGRNSINWGSAWPRYQQALDWWAGQRDVERARTRYLKIIFKAADPPRADRYYYTAYGNYIPLNILENALAAMPSGGRLTLHVRGEDDGAVVSIADTGRGMSPEVQRLAFEPFFTTRSTEGGTGLGLSLAQEIVQRYRGSIALDSAEGVGTTFTLAFPAISADAVRTPAFLPTLESLRILAVEDEPEVLDVLRAMLSSAGVAARA